MLDQILFGEGADLWGEKENLALLEDGVKKNSRLIKLLFCLKKAGILNQAIFKDFLNDPIYFGSIEKCVRLMYRSGILTKENFELLVNKKSRATEFEKQITILFNIGILNNSNYNLILNLDRNYRGTVIDKLIDLNNAGILKEIPFELLDKRAVTTPKFLNALFILSPNKKLAVGYYDLLAKNIDHAEDLAFQLKYLFEAELLTEVNIALILDKMKYATGLALVLSKLSKAKILNNTNLSLIASKAELSEHISYALDSLISKKLLTEDNLKFLLEKGGTHAACLARALCVLADENLLTEVNIGLISEKVECSENIARGLAALYRSNLVSDVTTRLLL